MPAGPPASPRYAERNLHPLAPLASRLSPQLGLRLAKDFSADPSILRDIDFAALARRLERDMVESDRDLRRAKLLPTEELEKIASRQREALANLSAMVLENPEVMYPKEKGSAAAAAVPKLRRVISKARELPLTVELPASMNAADGLDMSLALNETKNVAVAIKEVWQRLNGADIRIEEELISLQRESKALLSLRTEATKLRAGIRLVRRQKEMKSAYFVRFGESANLLGETLRADESIMKLVRELSLKAALLEMERIYITLESELSLTSALVDQLLSAVERYGEMEASLRGMIALVQEDAHEDVDEAQLQRLETDIAFLLLQLGLTTADSKQESFSWARTREQTSVTLNKAKEGVSFYGRGCQLMAEDVQLMVNMIARAAVQGYTLQARESKLLRRIGKDMLTLIPFVVILIIPLSPLGHVLVFSFIQRTRDTPPCTTPHAPSHGSALPYRPLSRSRSLIPPCVSRFFSQDSFLIFSRPSSPNRGRTSCRCTRRSQRSTRTGPCLRRSSVDHEQCSTPRRSPSPTAANLSWRMARSTPPLRRARSERARRAWSVSWAQLRRAACEAANSQQRRQCGVALHS